MKKEFEEKFLTKSGNFKKDVNPYEVFNYFNEYIKDLWLREEGTLELWDIITWG